MKPSPHRLQAVFRALRFVPLLGFFCAITSSPAHALTIPLDGNAFKNGRQITGSGSPLAAATLYNAGLTLNIAGGGIFADYLGGTSAVDISTVLPTYIGSVATADTLNHTFYNPAGTVPATLAKGPAYQYFFHLLSTKPSTGTTVYLRVLLKGIFDLAVDSSGKFTFQMKNITLSAVRLKYVKGSLKSSIAIPITAKDTLAIESGSLTVTPSTAPASSVQPDIMLLVNKYIVIGNDQYSTTSPGAYPPDYVTLKKGHSRVFEFILQNDGPSSDDFAVAPATPSTGFTFVVTDPANNNADATTETFTLASGETHVVEMKVSVTKSAGGGYLQMPLSMKRKSDSSVVDWAAASVFVP